MYRRATKAGNIQDAMTISKRFYKRLYNSIWVFSLPKMMRKMMSSLLSLFTQCLMLHKIFTFRLGLLKARNPFLQTVYGY